MLTALSLGAGGGAGFLPPAPMGRLAGGAGGAGLAFALAPLVWAGGGGTERAATGGAGGGMGLGVSSTR